MTRLGFSILPILAACSDRPPDSRQATQTPESTATPAPAPDSVARTPAGDSLLAALEQLVLGYGHSRASIIQVLGTPRSLEQSEARGPDDELDTLITITYPAVEIILRKGGIDHQEYFSNVRVVDTGLALPPPVQVFRTSRADLTRLLGSPEDTQLFGDTTVIGYEAARGPVIQFYFLRDILCRIRWVYELG